MLGAGPTLSRYVALRFMQAIGVVFFTVVALIYLVDFVELLRRASDVPAATTGRLAELAALRTPMIAEQVMPFAVLFGSLWAFLGLSRKLELVVARAAGISVWQFGLPPVLVALTLGVVLMTAYNPVAAAMKARADRIEARIFSRATDQTGRSVWLRQASVDGSSVMRAVAMADEGRTLSGVVAYLYDEKGQFIERVDAARAELDEGYWRLSGARIVTPGLPPQEAAHYLLATALSPDEVRQTLGTGQDVSFWRLPAAIEQLKRAGLSTTRLDLRWQGLLARPLLLVAMVIVAACVSLRFFRFGGVARMVMYGVVAGFMLYLATQVGENLGTAGVMSAAAAAWSPAVVGTLLGVLALLHLEDG